MSQAYDHPRGFLPPFSKPGGENSGFGLSKSPCCGLDAARRRAMLDIAWLQKMKKVQARNFTTFI
uniref:Uncharacterized protein n=1 Tax=Salix viminalis TaxID=40686 RepID=A0A6N2M8N4_SALVM